MTIRTQSSVLLVSLLFTLLPLRSWAGNSIVQEKERSTYTSTTPHSPTAPTIAADDTLGLRLAELLNDELFDETQVSLYVYDLTVGRRVFAHQEKQRMRPASCQKVITAIAALHTLGTQYNYHTDLCLLPANEEEGTCARLYLRAGYDPLLEREDLKAFAEAIKAQGITRLEEPLVVDLSLKDDKERGWGWCWDDKTVPLTPLLYKNKDQFLTAFQSVLNDEGIEWDGRLTHDICPDDTVLLCRRTHSIDQVLLPMMKESDNSAAESLFYQLAAHSGKRYAGRKQAVPYIHQVVKETGLRPDDYLMADGSGLSLYNYASAELLGRLLIYAYEHKDLYRHLLPSLPIAGEDGTLERRMVDTPAESNVRAKTGTVEGISTLAGYCTAANGHTLCFAIMNQGVRRATHGRDFQDKVCRLLCE